MMVDIHIADTDDLHTGSCQYVRTQIIPFDLLCLVMSTAIQFQCNTGLRTEEIDDVVIDGLLPLKANRVCTQKFIP